MHKYMYFRGIRGILLCQSLSISISVYQSPLTCATCYRRKLQTSYTDSHRYLHMHVDNPCHVDRLVGQGHFDFVAVGDYLRNKNEKRCIIA